MSKFWESLGEKLADRWLAVSIPALVFWIGGLLAWLSTPGRRGELRLHSESLDKENALIQVSAIVIALILVALSGIAVQSLDTPIQRLLEGYWPWPFRGLRRLVANRKANKAFDMYHQFGELSSRLWEEESPSVAEIEQIANLNRRLRRIPYKREAIMPTRFGNTLKAADMSSQGKYGLDPKVLWAHLRQLMPENARRDFEKAQSALSLNMSLITWGLLFTAFGAFKWWAVPLGLAVSFGALLAAPRQATNVADLAQMTWDLYRFELYKCLRWPLPKNPGEEHQRGLILTTYLVRGHIPGEISFTSQT